MLELDDLASRIATTKVLCVGDVQIEEVVYGLLRSSAVEYPVLNAARSEVFVGGAAAVARQVAALGVRCSLVGLVGDDRGADVICNELGPTISLGLVRDPTRTTPWTVRFMSDPSSAPLLESVWEGRSPAAHHIEDRLIARVIGEALDADLIVLADNDSDGLSERLIHDTVAAARQQGIPTIVTSTTSDFGRYAGATILAPRFDSLCSVGGQVPKDLTDLETISLRVLEGASVEALLVVDPRRGLSFIPRASAPTHLTHWVASSRGCSDAGIAAFAVALACGLSWKEAMVACQQANDRGLAATAAGVGSA